MSRPVDLVQHQHARLAAAVERVLEIRQAPAASFEDLDAALEDLRRTWSVCQRLHDIAGIPDEVIDTSEIPEATPEFWERARLIPGDNVIVGPSTTWLGWPRRLTKSGELVEDPGDHGVVVPLSRPHP